MSAAFSPRRRRLATTVASLALCLAAGTVGARANGGVLTGADAATRAPSVAKPPIYAPSNSAAYSGTPGNPLVRPWGVYQGPAEMPWLPYLAASGEQQMLLDKIVQRPKATWFGAWQPNADITDRVETYLELTTGGDPERSGPDDDLPHGAVGAGVVRPPADGRGAGQLLRVDRRLRRRRR